MKKRIAKKIIRNPYAYTRSQVLKAFMYLNPSEYNNWRLWFKTVSHMFK